MRETTVASSSPNVSATLLGRASDGETCLVGYVLSVKMIRIVIADDHDASRAGLRRLLSAQAGIEVVGEARNGSEAYDIVFNARPELIVLDLDMPIEDGASAGRRILALTGC